MRRILPFSALFLCAISPCAATPLHLPTGTAAILDHIYSAQNNLAIQEAQQMQRQLPAHPLGYILEAEAIWWKIWCSSAEYKYGMTVARHREKLPADRHYLDISAKALSLSEASLKEQESAEMYFYAGMAEALAARLYALRGEGRPTAKAGVHAREDFMKALALDHDLADADMGLGLYDYYVDTLSAMARVLRFFMGIPGGSKEEGIQLLYRAMHAGEITKAVARFYLAINLHNYDQRYEEALAVISPLVTQYPANPLFLLVQGDLLGKLGRRAQAIDAYRAAGAAAQKISDPVLEKKLELLVRQSIGGVSDAIPGK